MISKTTAKPYVISLAFVMVLAVAFGYILKVRNGLLSDLTKLQKVNRNKALIKDCLNETTQFNNELIRFLLTTGVSEYQAFVKSGESLLLLTDSLRKTENHEKVRLKLDTIYNQLEESIKLFSLHSLHVTAPAKRAHLHGSRNASIWESNSLQTKQTLSEDTTAIGYPSLHFNVFYFDHELQKLLELENEIISGFLEVLKWAEKEEERLTVSRREGLAKSIENAARKLVSILSVIGFILLLFLILLNIEEWRLRKFKKQLEYLEKERQAEWSLKEKYLLFLTHEIKSPLQIISGFSEVLYRTHPLRESKLIKQTSDYLINLVEEVLRFKKHETLQKERSGQTVDLKKELMQTLLLFQHQLEQQKMALSVHLPEEVLYIKTELTKIQQVVINILNNVVKHSKATKVEFGLEYLVSENDDFAKVKIRISDNGIGIRNENMRGLFEPFVSGKSGIGNTGLGMHISREILLSLDGELLVHSEPEKGTVCEMVFKATIDNLGSGEPEVNKHLTTLSTRVLLVDDDTLMAEMLKTSDPNGLLAHAVDLSSAQRFLLEENAEVVVLDVHLKEGFGLDLLPWLQANLFYRPKVVLCSANREWVEEAFEQGLCEAFLIKPFRYELLIKQVNVLGEKPSSQAYSLENFLAYALGDEVVLKRFVLQFIENTRNDLELVRSHLAQEDFEGIYDLFHKMKNTIGQLKADYITQALDDYLKQKETTIYNKEREIQKIVKWIDNLCNEVELHQLSL